MVLQEINAILKVAMGSWKEIHLHVILMETVQTRFVSVLTVTVGYIVNSLNVTIYIGTSSVFAQATVNVQMSRHVVAMRDTLGPIAIFLVVLEYSLMTQCSAPVLEIALSQILANVTKAIQVRIVS